MEDMTREVGKLVRAQEKKVMSSYTENYAIATALYKRRYIG